MMLKSSGNYDEINEFIDYNDKEEWKKYVEEIIDLFKTCAELKFFNEHLAEISSGYKLIEFPHPELVIGGVSMDTSKLYRKNSLSKFMTIVFGLKLDNLAEWVRLGSDFSNDFSISKQGTEYTKLFYNVYAILKRAISSQVFLSLDLELEINNDQYLQDPNIIAEVTGTFFKKLSKFMSNQNYHTYFLSSLKQTNRKIIKAAYPKLSINLIEEFGMEKFGWQIPISDENEHYQDYELLCWPEYNINKSNDVSLLNFNRLIDEMRSVKKSFGGSIALLNHYLLDPIQFRNWDSVEYMKSYFPGFEAFLTSKNDLVMNISIDGSQLKIKVDKSYVINDRMINNPQITIFQLFDEKLPLIITGLVWISSCQRNQIKFNMLE